jgi:hypothetical protein
LNFGLTLFVAIFLILACLLGGVALLAHGVPGITHTFEAYSAMNVSDPPSLSPDSSRVAYALSVQYTHDPVGIARIPDGGAPLITGGNVDLWIFDLPTAEQPKRIFRRSAANVTRSRCAWMRDGIYVRYDDLLGSHYFLVNAEKRRSRSLEREEGDAAFSRYEALSSDWQRVRHVEFDRGRFFWLDPRTSTKSLLLDLPANDDGHPVNAGYGW